MFDIKEELKKLPDSPGVYIHKDEFGQVIYVGKAVSLRNRVRQYFQSPKNQTPKTRELVKHIKEFEYINAGSEMEALVLECNLIKKYRPKYNILLRDDKTYPYIKVTIGEEFPRVIKCRSAQNDKSKYFGPFASDWATNEIIELLNDTLALKRCNTQKFSAGSAPCLNYHIHRCRGLCTGKVSREEYIKSIDLALDFLQGKNNKLEKNIESQMQIASDELRFEDAAKLRNYLSAIETIKEKQRVVLQKPENIDVITLVTGLSGSHALVFAVRDGKLSGRESFFLGDNHDSKEIMISEFIKQYYFQNPMIPKEVLVTDLPEDFELLSLWLSKEKGQRVIVHKPERGEKKALLDVIRKDAFMMISDIDARTQRQIEKQDAVRDDLCEIFGKDLGSAIHRVESYDISNINGMDSVAGMVVFVDGKPMKKDYRRFKIKTVEGANDTGSMTEVLFRRFTRAIEGDPAFITLPDIIFMDGGPGQVHAAMDVLSALKLNIPVAGMIKDDKHRTRSLLWQDTEISLKGRTALFSYCGAIQEEVHRFAIDYHHSLRGKAVSKSILDNIEGVGEKRKLALFERFGSIDNIKKASLEEIASEPGFNKSVAEKILNYLNKND